MSAAGWHPTLGAILQPGGGVTYRVWAPGHGSLEVVIDGRGTYPMQCVGDYWQFHDRDGSGGDRYRYRVDGGMTVPDPCSRSQPDGVHAASEVIARDFDWTDDRFSPPAMADLVIYEAHIGTLTAEGTFDAAVGELGRLKELGITAVEVMPVAAFPGRWNWGYDGVCAFAPFAGYGGPGAMRRFVDAAHGMGLAVILDVVYNHFGPDGNYTGVFSDRYLTSSHQTPWGDAVNFDQTGCEGVRAFVAENLLHWHHEYHIDGFRFDATHAITDESPRHILAEASEALAAHPRNGRPPFLIAETHENDVRYLKPVADGGFGFDAVWADDFHNVTRNILHPEREGYLASFAGTIDELAQTVEHGFLFEGQRDPATGEPRGTPARKQQWSSFVYCLQNHDQVGNRAFGERLHHTAGVDDVLAATLLLLLLPQTPLLFQGQEFLATSPFQYFTDHNGELGKLVTEGRRTEFAGFAAFRDPDVRDRIPDPQAEGTFLRSKLAPSDAATPEATAALALHRRLLQLRATDPVLQAARAARLPLETQVAARALAVTIAAPAGVRMLAVNFGDAEVSLRPPFGQPKIVDAAGASPGAVRAGEQSLVLPPHTAGFMAIE